MEEFAKILIGENGVKPGSVNKQTQGKQTQGATFGERVNRELINFFTTEESKEFGEDLLILTGTPTGKVVQCPPPGCGCTDHGGESCSCKLWPGSTEFCLCLLCPDKGSGMPPIDLLPPPNNDNGIKTKDIVIILKDNKATDDDTFNDIVRQGLTKVAELRKNKVDALVIKVKHNTQRIDINNIR